MIWCSIASIDELCHVVIVLLLTSFTCCLLSVWWLALSAQWQAQNDGRPCSSCRWQQMCRLPSLYPATSLFVGYANIVHMLLSATSTWPAIVLCLPRTVFTKDSMATNLVQVDFQTSKVWQSVSSIDTSRLNLLFDERWSKFTHSIWDICLETRLASD